MFAIIESGGKQYKVQKGDTILVDLFEKPENNNVVFDKVLLLQKDDSITLGKPTVPNASVTAEFISEGKGKKIDVFKMKRRKKQRKRIGHRQKYSMVKILGIQLGSEKLEKNTVSPDPEPEIPETKPKEQKTTPETKE